MPNWLVQSPEEEECWQRAKELATMHFGHKPSTSVQWAYVTGIYKHMCMINDVEVEELEEEEVVEEWRPPRPRRPGRPKRP